MHKPLNHLLFFTLLALGMLLPKGATASHIVGGDLSYNWLSYDPATNSNRYRITMKIYRNCNRFAMDDFDILAPVSIFEKVSDSFYDRINDLKINLIQPVVNIPPETNNPCLILPPDICVEAGSYVFEVVLPVISNAYVIVYQRCCRNASIANIFDPDRTGATYSISITEAAQRLRNDSPEFKNFPPIVICANEPLNFDHSASDTEGDQLEYAMCNPLIGAGVLGAFEPGDPTSCEGFRPDPACPPPFRDVLFRPPYTAQVPMLGDPIVQIDRNTGLMTGIPTILGQFVVGTCVREYRNGVLLSEIRRDFQFNVANCDPLVDAVINADEISPDMHFVVNVCGETEVTLDNRSFQRDKIDEFIWQINIDGQTIENREDWNPTFVFPDTGVYSGSLILNPFTDCGDTAFVDIRVLPDLNADFDFTYDTCVAGPVKFFDQSVSEGSTIVNWNWNFADGNSDNDRNPEHLYRDPGDYRVNLQVTDANGCIDIAARDIEWFPAPPIIVVEPSSFSGCIPLTVNLVNLSSPIDETYDIVWDLGDGQRSTAISPSHTYENEGVYSLSVEITSPLGCQISTSWEDWITAFPNPVADFTFSPEEVSNFNPEVQFTDQSIDAISWEWTFGGESRSFAQHPFYIFPDTGLTTVQLVVTHMSGCMDTMIQLIDVIPQITYFLPNAFTPNEDSVNDFFRGKGLVDGLKDFKLSIWNRWGEMIFETNDPLEAWNGKKNNSGKISPNGVYVYLLNYRNPRGQLNTQEGFVTLIR